MSVARKELLERRVRPDSVDEVGEGGLDLTKEGGSNDGRR